MDASERSSEYSNLNTYDSDFIIPAQVKYSRDRSRLDVVGQAYQNADKMVSSNLFFVDPRLRPNWQKRRTH